MTDVELLRVVEATFRDAVEEAEFTRLPKDLAYCQMIADKMEALRAKVDGRSEPVHIELFMDRGRVVAFLSMPDFRFSNPGRLRR